MKITFLGTGNSYGIPIISYPHPVCLSKDKKDKRLRSSILINENNKNILIDCGPDFRYQMLRTTNNNIDAILLTHEHRDHIAGLDDIKPIYNNYKKSISIYSLPRVLNEVKKKFNYLFLKNTTSPIFFLKKIKNKSKKIKGIKVKPLKILHGNLSILAFRIKNFAYITDASYIPKGTMKKLTGLEVLVLNSLRKYPNHISHFTLNKALDIILKLNPIKSYITHISPILGFHKIISKELPSNVYLAYDKLSITL